MVVESQTSLVLLPIKPEFANAIFSGEKRVEFRKQCFKRSVTHVAVYSSFPEKKVIGYFEISFVDVARPMTIWKRYRKCGAILYKDFKGYYENKSQAVVFGIKGARRLKKPIALNQLRRGQKAPQSFCYLPDRYLRKLEKLEGVSVGSLN